MDRVKLLKVVVMEWNGKERKKKGKNWSEKSKKKNIIIFVEDKKIENKKT